jgi:hypothetical protein
MVGRYRANLGRKSAAYFQGRIADRLQRKGVSFNLNYFKENKMLDLNKIDKELSLLVQTEQPRKDLSKSIKLLFAKQYEGNNVFCYANGVGEHDYSIINADSEFIFDLIVVEESPFGNSSLPNVHFIKKTLLALESELDGNLQAVLEDFQKLLIANSQEKVIIFRCHSTEFDSWSGCLEEHLNNYESEKKETYHIIAKINDLNTFKRKTL